MTSSHESPATTLTAFILARLAEDEATAINWTRFEIRDGIPGSYVIKDRVLADVAAKRAIVEMHEPDLGHPDPWAHTVDPSCTHYDAYDHTIVYEDECPTLRFLATIWADHPDYDESWRP